MELTKKTFLERLQYVQGELKAMPGTATLRNAQSPELRRLIQNEYANYDPDLTIIDAIHAVSELVDAYEQNYCLLHLQLQPAQRLEPSTFDVDDLEIPFC